MPRRDRGGGGVREGRRGAPVAAIEAAIEVARPRRGDRRDRRRVPVRARVSGPARDPQGRARALRGPEGTSAGWPLQRRRIPWRVFAQARRGHDGRGQRESRCLSGLVGNVEIARGHQTRRLAGRAVRPRPGRGDRQGVGGRPADDQPDSGKCARRRHLERHRRHLVRQQQDGRCAGRRRPCTEAPTEHARGALHSLGDPARRRVGAAIPRRRFEQQVG